jgi:hypothetical protein
MLRDCDSALAGQDAARRLMSWWDYLSSPASLFCLEVQESKE